MLGALDSGAVDLAVGSSYDSMPRCAACPGRDSSLLDLLASSPEPPRIRELPYSLRDRQHGESKLDTEGRAGIWDAALDTVRTLSFPRLHGLDRLVIAVDISIIIPVYNEVKALTALYRELTDVLGGLEKSAEIFFIDDGSRDGSSAVLDELALSDARVQVLHLRRNYGQTAAIMAGFQHCTGDVIITMDADGQNDPADIPRLLNKVSEGFDVVSGWRIDRDDRFSRRLPSVVANRLISSLLGVPLHDYGCTLKAYRREVIEDVRLYGEMHRFIPIYAAWEGARVTELPVTHHPRLHGKSKYGLSRISRVFLDLVILYFIDRAFDRPMQFFGKLGLVFWGLAFLTLGWALVLKLGYGVTLIQTPLPLLAATIGLSGVLFILLGIIAEVLTRIYFETRGKPPYKVESVSQHSAAARPTVVARKW